LVGEEPVCSVAQTPPWPALYAEDGCLCVLASPTKR
jgi:hypothetical protein